MQSQKITRRNALTGAGAAAGAMALATPALASVSQSDAELVRLGAEFDRLHAEWLPLLGEWQRLHEAGRVAWEAKNIPFGDGVEFFAVQDETGSTAASDKNDAALDSLEAVAQKIRELPASGFAGLAVKARVLWFDTAKVEDFDVPEKDMDWGPKCFHKFAAEIERLARA